MMKRLHLLLALVLCATVTALTFSPAHAQNKQKQPEEIDLNAHRAPRSIMEVSNRAPIEQQSLVPGAVGVGHEAVSGTVASFPFNDVTDVTEISAGYDGDFVGAGAIGSDPDEGYFIAETKLYSFDASTGDSTFVADLGTSLGFTGMAYDAGSGIYYGVTADFGSSSPVPGSLYEIDVSSGTTTLVGELTGIVVPVDLAIDGSGNLYAVDRDDDNLYEIDSSTAAGTLVGAIGFDSNFDQGMVYDAASGNVYFAAINAGNGNAPEVHTLDTSTGSATLVGTFSSLRQFGWLGGQDFSGAPNLVANGLDFDVAVVGNSSTQTVTIHNNGQADLTVSDLSISGADAGAFSVVDSSPFTLSSGGSQDVDVTFSPSTAGTFEADLEITSNDDGSTGTVVSAGLVGEGIAPVASIDEDFDDLTTPNLPDDWSIANVNGDTYTWQTSADGDSPPNAASIRWNPNIAMNDWLFTKPVSVTGGTTYRVQFSYATASDFFKENLEVKFGDGASPGAMNDPALFSVEDYGNTVYTDTTVTFTPSSDGTVYVGFHGFSDANQFELYVDDVVVEEVPSAPILSATPDSLGFGDVPVGAAPEVHTEETVIANTGGGPLTVSDLSFSGADASDFSVTDAPARPFDVAVGETDTVEVGFAPSSGGAKSADLEITSNSGGSPGTVSTVALEGFGLAPVDSYPYTANFDDGSLPAGWEAPPGPDGTTWEILDAPPSFFVVGAEEDHTTGSGFWANLDDSDVDSAAAVNLNSAILDFSSLSSPRLTFWYQNAGPDTDAGEPISGLAVDVSDDAGATFDSSLVSVTDSIGDWTQYELGLSAYAGENAVVVRFRGIGTDGFRSDPSLDDVTVEEGVVNPMLTVVPDSVGFGDIETGGAPADTTREVLLTNDGGSALTVSDLAISGTDAGDFSLVSAPSTPFDVPGGETDTVTVGFAPSDASFKEAVLSITSNDGGSPGSVSTVELTGTGVPEGIAYPYTVNFDEGLPDGWTAPESNGAMWEIVDDPGFSTYGAAEDHTTGSGFWAKLDDSDVDSAAAVNLNSATLDLSGLATPRLAFWYQNAGEDTEADDPISDLYVDVSADAGVSFDSSLASVTSRVSNWTLYVVDLSAYTGEDDVVIRFRGVGTASFGSDPSLDDVTVEEAPTDPIFSINPDEGAFGVVRVSDDQGSESDSLLFTVSNTGSGTLTVEEPAISGADPEAFAVESDTAAYPVTLGVGERVGFAVDVADDADVGDFTADLNVSYDAGTGTQTAAVPLSATVITPNFGGPVGGYYFANSSDEAEENDDFQAPGITSLGIPPGNENDVTSQLGDDSVEGPYAIGFDFVYFGQTYDSFCLGSNGFITLLNTGEECTDDTGIGNNPIPFPDEPNHMIAWFWDDLNPTATAVPGTEVLYGQDEDGGLVLSFENYPEYGADANGFVSADVKLYPSADASTDGKIRIQYNEFGSSLDTTSVTVGIESDSLDTDGDGMPDDLLGIEYRFGDFGSLRGGPLGRLTQQQRQELAQRRRHLRGGKLLEADGDTLAVMFGPEPGALPVEVAGFAAATSDGGVDLTWQTLSEENNRGFQVEMKRHLTAADGSAQPQEHWQQVGFVESTAGPGGTSTEAQSYTLRVEDLDVGDYTFRLKQEDLGGGAPTPAGETVEATVGFDGAYALSGAYPNPFRDRATFEVAVKRTQHVRVEVYDVLGRRVMQVYDGELEGGSRAQTITVKARGLASGVYFYRVTGEDFTAAKKMMLVR